MKVSFPLSLLAFPLILLSCQEEIDIKLKSDEQKIVVEAKCSSLANSAVVCLSKTAQYFGEGDLEYIKDAKVTITQPDSSPVVLPMVQDGVYALPMVVNATGKTYKLNVVIGDKTYEAESTLPVKVKLDSIKVEEETGIMARMDGGNDDDGKTSYTIKCYAKDIPGDNYYRILAYTLENNELKLIDGNEYNNLSDDAYYNQTEEVEIQLSAQLFGGETVVVELVSLDKPAYQYFLTLMQTTSSAGGSFSVPENPKSNISNDVLGYFSVYASDTLSVVAPMPKTTTAN